MKINLKLQPSLPYLLSALLFLNASATWGQLGGLASGDVVKNFSWPLIENGIKQAQIRGKEAQVLSINHTQITDIEIDLFENGQTTTTITSPQSDYQTQTSTLNTRHTVRIERTNMTITAQSMRWNLKEQKGTLRGNVKVLLTDWDLGAPQPSSSPSTLPSSSE